MTDDSAPLDFDRRAAWLRRFEADTEGNLHALALRLRAALPDRVTIEESGSWLSRSRKTKRVAVQMDDSTYILDITNGRLRATIAMVVRGVAISTKSIDPADWFARLTQETNKATDQAERLSQSISGFMSS